MQIFISYSTGDRSLVHEIAEAVGRSAIIKYWDKDKEPGKSVWEDQIFKWIDTADIVIVIITDKTVSRAMSVGQEIGRAKAKGKKIIPLVASGVHKSDLGFLSGITYIPFDVSNIQPAISFLERFLEPKEEKPEFWKIFAVVLGLFLLAVMISKE